MINVYYDHAGRVRCGACNALSSERCFCTSRRVVNRVGDHVYRVEVLDSNTWRDSGQGPWPNADAAFDFAETEVAGAWRVVRESAHQPAALRARGAAR